MWLKQNFIYETHLTFGVYYWKLHASSALYWYHWVMATLWKKQYTPS